MPFSKGVPKDALNIHLPADSVKSFFDKKKKPHSGEIPKGTKSKRKKTRLAPDFRQ
jgi:hypothetical protein